MQVHYNRPWPSPPISLSVPFKECMHDNGADGSNLQVFNNVVLQPKSAWPLEGPQYIEASNEGPCALVPSSFTLETGSPLEGSISLRVDGGEYLLDSRSSNFFYVDISNEGDVSKVDVMIGPP